MRACCVYKVYTGIFRARGAPRLDSPALACAPLRIYMYITPRRVLLELSFFLLLSSLFLSFVSFSFSLSLFCLSLSPLSLPPPYLCLSLLYTLLGRFRPIFTQEAEHTRHRNVPRDRAERERQTDGHSCTLLLLLLSLPLYLVYLVY